MTQIDWVRAMFIGAIGGGFVWAVIIKLISFEVPEMPWQARSFLIAGIVNAVLLGVSWLLWRRSSDERGKSLAAALWIVPFIGAAFFASIFAIGAAGELLGG
jgi:hypothetical protein